MQPATVLDYAPTAPAGVLLGRLRAVLVVLGCVLVSAAIGLIIGPTRYRAVGLLQIDPPQTAPATNWSNDVTVIKGRQAAAVKSLTSPSNVKAAVGLLPPTARLTSAQVASRLKVRAIPDSRLIGVSYQHEDARTAAAVVNAVMAAGTTTQLGIANAATPPMGRQHDKLFPLAGAAVGLLLGVATVALRSK